MSYGYGFEPDDTPLAPLPPRRTPSMNIKVSIPVEVGGYTGQRDAWQSGTDDYTVSLEDDGRVKLVSQGYTKRTIWLDLDELKRAVAFAEDHS